MIGMISLLTIFSFSWDLWKKRLASTAIQIQTTPAVILDSLRQNRFIDFIKLRALPTTGVNGTYAADNLTIVSFVNGIYHTEGDWERIGRQLSATFSCSVRPFYNPSSGNWAADVSSASMQVIAKPNDFELAKRLADHLKALIAEVGEYGRVLHIAHSGGAILTYLAAKHHLSRYERTKMDVITFGGGYSLTRKYFRGRLVNYYASNDPCLYIDKRALLLSRSAAAAIASLAPKVNVTKVVDSNIVANHNISNNNNYSNTFLELFEHKHNTSFVFMHGITGHPIRDHSLEGPTYKIALALEANELSKRRQEIWTLVTNHRRKQSSKVRKLRKLLSKHTGQRHVISRARLRVSEIYNSRVWKDVATRATATAIALLNENQSIDHWGQWIGGNDSSIVFPFDM